MRKSHRFQVRTIDGLEPRLVLSAAVPDLAVQSAAITPTPQPRVNQLKAAFVVPLDNSQTNEAATSIPVSGVGLIRKLGGNAAITGSLQGTGRKGTGDVVLRHTDGSLTLRLKNPQYSGTQRAPIVTMRYRVVAGEGRFSGARGTGTATMQLGMLKDVKDTVGMTLLLEGKLRYA